MSHAAPARMTSDAFLAWATEQPEGQHYELCAGQAVGMAPEPRVHALAKFRITAQY